MTILKLGSLLVLALTFFWMFVFGPYYDNLAIQGIVFIGVIGWNTRRHSLQETFSLLKFCIPFVLSIAIFGLIFHFTRLLGRQDWLEDTLVKCLIFPSSLVFLKLLIGYITYLDILSLPISMKRRVDLITMKSAFQKGGKILSRFSWYMNTYSTLKSERKLKYQMTKFACLIIALYLFLYEEIENSGRLLKNRYHHLHEVDK